MFRPGTISETGDPEWIGVLQHPDQPYGPNNLFVARYAFIAVPIGNALDLNAIHNQVLDDYAGQGTITQVNPPPGTIPGAGDAFMRNQGVGSWEINLAAFLADLNTNQWLPNPPPDNIYYAYYRTNAIVTLSSANAGLAFDDARALLAYRYQNNYLSLKPATSNLLFMNFGALRFNNVDDYGDGPLQVTPAPINEAIPGNADNPGKPWAGAENTNQFFDLQDLFNTSKTTMGLTPFQLAGQNDFSHRLLNIGYGASTYNRYTYYRLLSQMGVESAPEQNKLNLNYSNATTYFYPNGVLSNIIVYPGAETNLVPWTPLQFFTIAADKMLRDYSQEWIVANPSNFVATFNLTNTFGISDIPVLVSNRFVYTPAVQRVLQLAANIYDATTNRSLALGADFPSVFRPTFRVTNDTASGYTNVYINGYEPVQALVNGVEEIGAVTGTGDSQLNLPVDVNAVAPTFGFGSFTNINVYGVPWIIGAKKGFPNFNEFSMQSVVQVTRKLELTRPTLTALPSQITTNQMYIFSISNVFGVECWNSYSSSNLSGVVIWPRDTLSMTLTNDYGMLPPTRFTFISVLAANITNLPGQWPGTVQPWALNPNPNNPNSISFVIPLFTNVVLFTNLTYVYRDHQFEDTTNFPDLRIQPLPQFRLLTTNRLQVAMLYNISRD